MSPYHLAASSQQLLVAALVVWCVLDAALAFPRPLEYFNELAGGPANGYKYLVDSNLDWGQSFKELKAYLDQRGVKHIKLSAMMFLEPSVYGLDYEPLPPSRKSPEQFPSRFNPEPGVYVISASSLQGVATPDINTYAFFRVMTPAARIGHALFVYDVPQALPGEWVAQCIPPGDLLEPTDIVLGFGRNLRSVYLDCAHSRWYPAQAVPGWYYSPQATGVSYPQWDLGARTIWQSRTAEGQPALSILYVGQPTLPPGLEASARSDLGIVITAPIEMTGPLTFEGFEARDLAVRPGDQVLVFTAWRVDRQANVPLSIMAHLLDAQGQLVSVADGLGVPAGTWQSGDRLVQAHPIQVPLDARPGTYWVETGVYQLDNMERYQILQDGHAVGERLRLTSIEVRP